MIKIAIAEDNFITRKQYRQRFQFYEDIKIILMAKDGKNLIEKLSIAEELPDVILMDIDMPGMSGIDTTAIVKDKYPQIEIMMVTVFKDEKNIFSAIKSGASGYLLKDISTDEIVDSIKELVNGGSPLSKSIARKVLGYLQKEEPANVKADQEINLTDREIEILKAIVQDDTEYAIAMDLGISQHTVRSHVKNIYKKLQVHSRTAVVKAAYERNLLK
ncbi:MAG: response regulator transcription factor [Ignavibacteriae bacterium]|nr:DNA-binding response regulator [Ignavibacteriota bacterium]NOG99729.1 response regulator transcription factor [Ignavibacteriota bacterium]